jgi:hypothetical protein
VLWPLSHEVAMATDAVPLLRERLAPSRGHQNRAEPALRIDYCPECSGYLKTYLGEGEESLLLAD